MRKKSHSYVLSPLLTENSPTNIELNLCLIEISKPSNIHKFYESNLLFNSLYYAEACSKWAGPISAPLRTGNTAAFEEMSRWRDCWHCNDLTGPRFEPQTSRFRNECVPARPRNLIDFKLHFKDLIAMVINKLSLAVKIRDKFKHISFLSILKSTILLFFPISLTLLTWNYFWCDKQDLS